MTERRKSKQLVLILCILLLFASCTEDENSEIAEPHCRPFSLPSYTDNQQSEELPIRYSLIGGGTNAVFVYEDYAYVGVGFKLLTLDISNSAQIDLVSCLEFESNVSEILISQNYAYVSLAGGQKWFVIDISDLENPVGVADAQTSTTHPANFALTTNYLYVTEFEGGLRIFDIESPQRLHEVSHYSSTQQVETEILELRDVVIFGQYAFLVVTTQQGARIDVLDISNPANPYLLNTNPIAEERTISAIAASSGYVYVATKLNGDFVNYEPQVHIFDTTSPSNLREVGLYESDSPYSIRGITVSENHLYLAGRGITILDVANPTAPIEVTQIQLPMDSLASEVFILNNRAYVASISTGIEIVDVSNVTEPVFLGEYTTVGDIRQIEVNNQMAYVILERGVRIIDLSHPNRLVPIASLNSNNIGSLHDISVQDGLIYASYTEAEAELRAIDISDLTHPTIKNTHVFSEFRSGHSLAVSGDHVFWLDPKNLYIIDTSSSEPFSLVGSYEELDFLLLDVFAHSNYVYVVTTDGLQIWDISTPSNPIRIGTYDKPGYSLLRVTGSEGVVMLLASSNTLQILNVEEPSHPVEIFSYKLEGHPLEISLDNNTLYIVMESGTVLAYNASWFTGMPATTTEGDTLQ